VSISLKILTKTSYIIQNDNFQNYHLKFLF